MAALGVAWALAVREREEDCLGGASPREKDLGEGGGGGEGEGEAHRVRLTG